MGMLLPCLSTLQGCASEPLATGPALNGFVGAIADLWSDSAGNLYFRETAPFEPNGIQRITADGQLAPVGGIRLARLSVSKDSRIAVERAFSDGGALAEVTVGQDGALQFATIAEPATASSPDGTLATEAFLTNPAARMTSNGEIYLLDDCNIRLVGLDGRLKTLLEDNSCVSPPASAVDSQDRLWFMKGGYDFIIDKQGNLQSLPLRRDLGVDGAIALDAKDRLYVMGSSSLRRLEADGSVTVIAQGPLPDTAPIFALEAMGVDPDRNVYVVILGYSGTPRSLYRVDDDGQLVEIQRGLADGVFEPFFSQDRFLIDGQGRVWFSNGFFDAQGAYYSLGRGAAREIPPGAPELVQETALSGARLPPRVRGFGPDGSLYLAGWQAHPPDHESCSRSRFR